MQLNRWSVNDADRVSLPTGMIENLYKMLEEFERLAFERAGYDKFNLNLHGSQELRYLNSLAEEIHWVGPGGR